MVMHLSREAKGTWDLPWNVRLPSPGSQVSTFHKGILLTHLPKWKYPTASSKRRVRLQAQPVWCWAGVVLVLGPHPSSTAWGIEGTHYTCHTCYQDKGSEPHGNHCIHEILMWRWWEVTCFLIKSQFFPPIHCRSQLLALCSEDIPSVFAGPPERTWTNRSISILRLLLLLRKLVTLQSVSYIVTCLPVQTCCSLSKSGPNN